MFLNLDKKMVLVYDLKDRLRKEPSYMELIQKVTLDDNKPNIGLKGRYGLFGSIEWWQNIENGVIKTSLVQGEIVRLYKAGQDDMDEYNSFDLLLDSGELWSESIYLTDIKNKSLFKLKSKVSIFYVHDERKGSIDTNEVTYSNTVIEMAVSQ
ncbi:MULTISPECIES: hypothetical protein [Actinobacillus]|uniref:hypothetical protein n=1 Tax=Actinobacillus TaxID=713 RepID=UPI002418423C|nr:MULTISPECIES: hypothetical protein [Actinobacillus]MDG4952730.1 hypothetical protein [Actinobacillus equuli subsp. equuli]WGE34828.1 hypothetical protein NYR61_04585 [Actinobacillus genomosp. 1]WGE82662.1 hypothetical protein NYR86_06375 [Actinobacillus equuli subsp. equuli]